MSLEFDVDVVVRVKGRRSGDTYREVNMHAFVTLNGAEHFDAATAEAAVRALEDGGQVARRVTGQLPFMSDVKFRNVVIEHGMELGSY